MGQDQTHSRDRAVIQHSYVDHYFDPLYTGLAAEDEEHKPRRKGPRGGVIVPFTERLYQMLDDAEEHGFDSIVSFQTHGRCFVIRQPEEFVREVMPK